MNKFVGIDVEKKRKCKYWNFKTNF
jgi:hypothetical protein